MKALVFKEILDYSILGIKISKLNTPRNLIEYVVSIHAGSADIDGGTIDNVAIGATTRASVVYANYMYSRSLDIQNVSLVTVAQLTSAGVLKLYNATGGLLVNIDPNGDSFLSNNGTMVFGASSRTKSSSYEFSPTVAFINTVTMWGTLSSYYSGTAYNVGATLARFYRIHTIGGGSTWDTWDDLVAINTVGSNSLKNISGIDIGAAQWGRLSALNQPVATSASPTFAGLTIIGTIAAAHASVTNGLVAGNIEANAVGGNIVSTQGDLVGEGVITRRIDYRHYTGSDATLRGTQRVSSYAFSAAAPNAYLRAQALELNPVYALDTPSGRVSSNDMRTWEVHIVADYDAASGAISHSMLLETLLGYTLAGGDEYLIYDLFSRIKIYPSTIMRHRLQTTFQRGVGSVKYFVDGSFSPTLNRDGSFYDTVAPVGANALMYVENTSMYFYKLAAAGAFATTFYVTGKITLICT